MKIILKYFKNKKLHNITYQLVGRAQYTVKATCNLQYWSLFNVEVAIELRSSICMCCGCCTFNFRGWRLLRELLWVMGSACFIAKRRIQNYFGHWIDISIRSASKSGYWISLFIVHRSLHVGYLRSYLDLLIFESVNLDLE